MCLLLKHSNLYIRRELQEELGVTLPKDAFEMLFVFLQEWLVGQFLCSIVGYIFLCLAAFSMDYCFVNKLLLVVTTSGI